MTVFYFVYKTTDFALLANVQKNKITPPKIRKIRINQIYEELQDTKERLDQRQVQLDEIKRPFWKRVFKRQSAN